MSQLIPHPSPRFHRKSRRYKPPSHQLLQLPPHLTSRPTIMALVRYHRTRVLTFRSHKHPSHRSPHIIPHFRGLHHKCRDQISHKYPRLPCLRLIPMQRPKPRARSLKMSRLMDGNTTQVTAYMLAHRPRVRGTIALMYPPHRARPLVTTVPLPQRRMLLGRRLVIQAPPRQRCQYKLPHMSPSAPRVAISVLPHHSLELKHSLHPPHRINGRRNRHRLRSIMFQTHSSFIITMISRLPSPPSQ